MTANNPVWNHQMSENRQQPPPVPQQSSRENPQDNNFLLQHLQESNNTMKNLQTLISNLIAQNQQSTQTVQPTPPAQNIPQMLPPQTQPIQHMQQIQHMQPTQQHIQPDQSHIQSAQLAQPAQHFHPTHQLFQPVQTAQHTQ